MDTAKPSVYDILFAGSRRATKRSAAEASCVFAKRPRTELYQACRKHQLPVRSTDKKEKLMDMLHDAKLCKSSCTLASPTPDMKPRRRYVPPVADPEVEEQLDATFAREQDSGALLAYKDGRPLDIYTLRVLKDLGVRNIRVDLDTLYPTDQPLVDDTEDIEIVDEMCTDLRAIALCANTLLF